METYLGIDPTKQMIPVQPTAHYAMGGIPTDVDGRVVVDEKNTPLPGFYAAGECACVSVHGANRLGTNSLLDITVFGQRSARHILRFLKEGQHLPLPPEADGPARAEVSRVLSSTGEEKVAVLRAELQQCMDDNAGVMRDAEKLRTARSKLVELRERFTHIGIQDRGLTYNTDLTEALETGNLLDIAETIVLGALNREESRGGHYREDFPKRDDAHFLKHTLIKRVDGKLSLGYKPVVITRFQPKERTY